MAKIWHSLAFDAKYRSSLRSGRNLKVLFAIQRFNLYLSSEGRLGKCYRNGCVKIGSLAFEMFVSGNVKHDKQIARRAAVDTRFALTGYTQA